METTTEAKSAAKCKKGTKEKSLKKTGLLTRLANAQAPPKVLATLKRLPPIRALQTKKKLNFILMKYFPKLKTIKP